MHPKPASLLPPSRCVRNRIPGLSISQKGLFEVPPNSTNNPPQDIPPLIVTQSTIHTRMTSPQEHPPRPWNSTPRTSRELGPAEAEEASWELSPTIPNSYLKEHEENKSLLGTSNSQSRFSLHDVNLDNGELGAQRAPSSPGILRSCAACWNRFTKTPHGRIVVLGCKIIALLLFISLLFKEIVNLSSSSSSPPPPPTTQNSTTATPPPVDPKICSSKLWSNGHWEQRNVASMPLPPPIRTQAQMMQVSNFPAHYCASNRLPLTNTAMPRMENNTAEFWDWRYRVSSYNWRSGCEAAGIPAKAHPTPEQLISTLVNEGGWLMIGDSLSAQWFMSLSCYLAPYVVAVPHFTPETPWNSTQHLYLNNASSLVQNMELPVGFDLNTTPLVSVLRSGLLLSKPEIKDVIEKHQLINDNKPMFGPEKVFDMHTSDYIADFLDPRLRYSKMIASSGAHYTAMLFQDRPFHQIAEIFHRNFERWADIMRGVLEDPRSKGKKILYRTATAGHDKCYLHRDGPWSEEKILETPVWNWQYIPLFNRIADSVLTALNQPRLELMAIERPAMMRPDAHILIDCLHFTVGAGIIEGWTDFLYNYA